jgi:UDP-N-acetylmuramoylalanine--D-glutamate ligase
MLGEMASKAGMNAGVGGNLGNPALELIDKNMELYIIELSSFQLERTSLLNADVATVLNISDDHLDRHNDITSYAAIKSKVYNGNGIKVINVDDNLVADMREPNRQEISFSCRQPADFHLLENGEVFLAKGVIKLLPISLMQVHGKHNMANALAAFALGSAIGISEHAMCEALKEFKGLEHRMQKVAEINGVTWINDSKATNTGACIAALLGFTRKVILIAGGDCKKADMKELSNIIKDKAKAVVLMGKDAGLIETAIAGTVPAHVVDSITEAVKIAAKLADAGETVLLSPACASQDQFENYQERGNQFIQAVQGLQI